MSSNPSWPDSPLDHAEPNKEDRDPSSGNSDCSSDSENRQNDPSNLANSLLSETRSPATSDGSNGNTQLAEVLFNKAKKASRRSSAISYDSGPSASEAFRAPLPPSAQKPRLDSDPVLSPNPSAHLHHQLDNVQSNEHVDIAAYPTQQLLHLLATLLQHIAVSNDQLRASTYTSTGETPPVRRIASTIKPEMAKSSLARATPYYTPGSPSTSKVSLKDYFSMKPTKVQGSATRRQRAQQIAMSNISTPDEPQARDPLDEYESGDEDFDLPNLGIKQIDPELTASKAAYLSRNATLCFHARNIPGIGIEHYLQRVLKYCPTTNEVFIACLVYFDRMAKFSEQQRLDNDAFAGPPLSRSASFASTPFTPTTKIESSQQFAVDSFNVHRLLIAGLAVSSKFFSDVFYTNSRYSKVGGLPLSELNQLELQFLLLNDFSLAIELDELQRYADMLCLHWPRAKANENFQPVPFQTWTDNRPGEKRPTAANLSQATPAATARRMSQPASSASRPQSQTMTRSQSSNPNAPSKQPVTPQRPTYQRESSESESGSSTLGGRSDTSSVCSTGTITMSEQHDSAMSGSVESLETQYDMDVDVDSR